MLYAKRDAKEFASTRLKGVWGSTVTPFTQDLALDENGFRENLRVCVEDLKFPGILVTGKHGEFFSMTVEERKRTFELAMEVMRGKSAAAMSCWDMNLDTTIELLRHAQRVGAEFATVLNPVMYFGSNTDEAVYEYFRHLSEQVDIGIILWNNDGQGYSMSLNVCQRLAQLPNIVGIKDAVDKEHYTQLTHAIGERFPVSHPSEKNWLENMDTLDWKLHYASVEAVAMQTPGDCRVMEYTDLFMAGDTVRARRIRDSLEPVREALRSSRVAGKLTAHYKYWFELSGLAGGPVRRPLLPLTEQEKAKIREAYTTCGLGKPVSLAA